MRLTRGSAAASSKPAAWFARSFPRNDAASSAAIGLAVSAALMAGAFLMANTMVGEPAGVDATASSFESRAQTSLEVMVRDPGLTSTGLNWAIDADHMTRFGLSLPGQPNFIDYTKIKALRNGSLSAGANGAPDYPEVRANLGIHEGDFHLRTYPVLPGMEDPRWTKDPRGRFAYVGHVDAATGAATMTTYANASGNYLNASLAVRNDGLAHMIFVADVGAGNLASGEVIKLEQRHTRLLAPGEVQTLTVSFPKMAYSPAITGVSVQLSDGYGNILAQPAWVSATAPGGSNVAWAPLVSAGEKYYVSGDAVKFLADHYEGDGTRMNSDQAGRFVLVGPNGNEWVNASVTLPKNKPYTYACANCTTVGNYTGTLWDADVARKATDWVHVSADTLFTEQETLSAVAVKEISILKDLVVNFNGVGNDEAHPEGDVFSDASHIRELTDYLGRYSTLVVGSEVRQNSLNAAETKWGIADWVQAGGNLIVLGTFEAQSNWLEPVYKAAQRNANGGISAPDPTHPILVSPNRLSYDRYVDRARAWEIDKDQPFTHVLTRGEQGTSVQDTLTLSDPGAVGNGTVVLTSYMAGAITSPQDDAEAKKFLHNLLSQSYTMLFLDYGPPIPDGVPVGSGQRLVAIPHPNVPDAVVEVKLVMYVFG